MAYHTEPFNWRSHPWRDLYLGYAACKLLLLFPYWLVTYSLPHMRPHTSWPIRRCFGVEMFRYMCLTMSRIRAIGEVMHTPGHKKLEPGKGFLGVWMKAQPDLIVGRIKEWANTVNVDACDIPGYWYPTPGSNIPDTMLDSKPGPDEKILFHFHAGCYAFWSAHPSFEPCGTLVKNILRDSPAITRAFCPEFRRASAYPMTSRNPFPAALIDGISAYHYLVNVVGVDPANIILSGDSAGGHLAMAVARYLQDSKIPSLPRPGALLLISPHCDMNMYPDSPDDSLVKNIKTDYLHEVYFHPKEGYDVWAVRALLGPLYGDPNVVKYDPYISPGGKMPAELAAKVTFHGFPRTLLIAGGSECWVDQIRRVRNRMTEAIGECRMTYHEEEHSVHNYLLFEWHEPQRSDAFKLIGKWSSTL